MSGMDEDLSELSTDDLRRRLAQRRAEEDRVSYERRVLQGRMDILRDELERRGRSEHGDLIDRLTQIIAGAPSGSRGARARMPNSVEPSGPSDEAADALARLPDLSVEEIRDLAERFEAEERRVSERRREMFAVIDALEAELVRRYKDGSASPPQVGERN